MGVDIARAALAAGHDVVATGRNPEAVRDALGDADHLLVVKLDVTSRDDAEAAVKAAIERFGAHRRAGQQRRELLRRLLRGAHAGADRAAARDQPDRPDERDARRAARHARAALGARHDDLVIGRAGRLRVLQRLRRVEVRRGGLDGVARRRGRAVRHPHDDRQSRLLPDGAAHRASTNYATPSIADYAERNAAQHEFWEGQNGRQAGDPAKLAEALLTIAAEPRPPRRFIAGADAIETAEQRVAELRQQIDAFRELSTSLSYDPVAVGSG